MEFIAKGGNPAIQYHRQTHRQTITQIFIHISVISYNLNCLYLYIRTVFGIPCESNQPQDGEIYIVKNTAASPFKKKITGFSKR